MTHKQEPLPTVYLESTIPSYLVARPSRDAVVMVHQQLTREWWDDERHRYELSISPLVLQEIRDGDPDLAERREAIVRGLPVLLVLPKNCWASRRSCREQDQVA